MTANGQMIRSISSSEMVRDYEQAYSEATGLPLSVRPRETWQLPLHGQRKENPFCALVAKTNSSCAACLQRQEELAKSALKEPATVTCGFGLSETAVPIQLGGETIGFLQTGQVLSKPPTEASFQKAVEHGRQIGLDLDRPETREAYFQTKVVPPKKMEAVARLLTIFAEHLALRSNQILMQQKNSENPMITRAKQYIEEHYMEDLSLASVARAVHASSFHFCKMFTRSTGIHFTEYVSRTRIEKAKELLLNVHLRISEIAYQVGFQSLTHFNRVFKKITNESPTEYRNRHRPPQRSSH